MCRVAGQTVPSRSEVFTTMSDQNKITIFGPDDMGLMIVDFKTAKGRG
jgi:hypothetical protein